MGLIRIGTEIFSFSPPLNLLTFVLHLGTPSILGFFGFVNPPSSDVTPIIVLPGWVPLFVQFFPSLSFPSLISSPPPRQKISMLLPHPDFRPPPRISFFFSLSLQRTFHRSLPPNLLAKSSPLVTLDWAIPLETAGTILLPFVPSFLVPVFPRASFLEAPSPHSFFFSKRPRSAKTAGDWAYCWCYLFNISFPPPPEEPNCYKSSFSLARPLLCFLFPPSLRLGFLFGIAPRDLFLWIGSLPINFSFLPFLKHLFFDPPLFQGRWHLLPPWTPPLRQSHPPLASFFTGCLPDPLFHIIPNPSGSPLPGDNFLNQFLRLSSFRNSRNF